MTPLIDGDILAYELAFAAESFWKHLHKEKGEEVQGPPPFEIVEEMIERRIPEIIQESESTGVPEMCFSGSKNFRNFIAFTQPYKDKRAARPFHYKNVKFVLSNTYKTHLVEGLEADDLIGLLMTKSPGKYICVTRDKDLRQIPGMHYGWEVNKQPAFGPYEFNELGVVFLQRGKSTKIIGGGAKFFFCQVLMGDSVDTVPGIPGMGPVNAYAIINGCDTVQKCEEAVSEAYKAAYGLDWRTVMREQARLLYMTREGKNGFIKLWGFSDEEPIWMNYQTGEILIE